MIILSRYLIPMVLVLIVGYGLAARRPVFDDFLTGAASGIRTVVKITPTLIGLMTAVGMLQASGFLDALVKVLASPAAWVHIPAPLLPVILIRLISNSAAVSLMLNLFREYGPDSSIGMAASIMMSCTESVFYCISLYFGSVNIRKTRYVLVGSMIATAAGVVASLLVAGI